LASPDSILEFSTREEVEEFERNLELALRRGGSYLPPHISLARAWDVFQPRDDRRRLFAALLDVKLTFIFCQEDFLRAAGGWQRLSPSRTRERPWSPDTLAHALEGHRNLSAYVLRARAFWNKMIGFLVLLRMPDRYDEFARARSPLSQFKKLIAGRPDFPDDFVELLRWGIDDLGRFRTPEAHGTGILRKWTFSDTPWTSEDFPKLLAHFSALVDLTIMLGNVIDVDLRAEQRGGSRA